MIEGAGLTAASDESDVAVQIGRAACNVTSLAHTQLVCTPPPEQPEADAAAAEADAIAETLANSGGVDAIELVASGGGGAGGDRLPLVVVRVGRRLRFAVGRLRYEPQR